MPRRRLLAAGQIAVNGDRTNGTMAGAAQARVTFAPEASGFLVAPPVFKTGGRRSASPAGSIPVRLRIGSPSAWAPPPGNGRRPVAAISVAIVGPCAESRAQWMALPAT